jgi:hypothetical protein
MSIGVQSTPELYTILMGWNLYDKLWTLLTETGIAYLPFVGMILKNVSKSYVMHGHHGTQYALRSMELSFIATLLLIFFGASPFIPLDVHSVSYTPLCSSDKSASYPGKTGTTYDNAFAIPDGNIRVPIWWYAVIAVSEGVTSEANTFLGCVTDIRKMMTTINMTQIADPELAEEVRDFTSMCYMPAKTQFSNDNKNDNTKNLEKIADKTKEYGVEDTEWMGSHGFSDTYYKDIKPLRPVRGFFYNPSDDINADTHTASDQPAYGTPSCDTWWNDASAGLKTRVYNQLQNISYPELNEYAKNFSEKDKDNVIKTIMSHASTSYENASSVSDFSLSHIGASLGIWYHAMEGYPKIYAAGQAAPIIQALLLLMSYVFLPFALVFGGYKPSTFLKGAILVFSLIFWSFIWHLVSWTDKTLIDVFYSGWLEKQGANATLVDMIIGSLIIAAPLFWFVFMNAVGVEISDIASNASGSLHKTGENAASKGGQLGQGAATAATKAAVL